MGNEFDRLIKRTYEENKLYKNDKSYSDIKTDERNRVLNKARIIIETGRGERLDEEEIKILKEIAGVYYAVYMKAIETLDNKERRGKNNESQIER